MANLRAIRARIKSVQNTQQITKSMKMVAASKLRHTQTAFSGMKGYAGHCAALLEKVGPGDGRNPFLSPHGGDKPVCYVLIVGNRGLCGTYNTALLRFLEDHCQADGREAFLVVAGRWGRDMIAASGIPVQKTFPVGDTPTTAESRELTEYLKGLFLGGETDEVVLVYQQFKSVLSQTPVCRTLLPLSVRADGSAGDTIFEPDRNTVVDTLVELTLSNTVYATLLEARTGEHSSRMTAMTSASDSTEELIAELTLELNHARQSAITTEITEIVGGAEALSADHY